MPGDFTTYHKSDIIINDNNSNATFPTDSTVGKERSNMTERELRAKAEAIARLMKARGLQPWHIKYELRNRAIPPMLEKKLAKMIEQKLN